MVQRQADPRFTAHDLITAASSGYSAEDVLSEAISSEDFTALGYIFEQQVDEDGDDSQE